MRGATPLPETPRTIDAIASVALLAGVGQAVLGVLSGRGLTSGLSIVLLLVAAVLYAQRSVRHERSWTAAAFTACAAAAWALTATPLLLAPLVVGLLLLHLDHGRRAALVGAALALVLGVTVLFGIDGAGAGYVLREAVGLALILYAVLWVAGVVAESYAAQHRSAVLSLERDQALAELEEAHVALAASIETEKDLVLAQERARAAGELHDGLGHRLTAIRLGLDFADRAWSSDPEAAHDEVRAARDATVQALQEMRVWVRALSPSSHTSASDAASFEAIADTFRGTGMAVRVQTHGLDDAISPEWSLFAHRLIQEGLTNALRHGAASEVDIGLQHSPDGLRICLRDNGASGSTTAQADVVEGFGLRSLRERAESLGGALVARPLADGFELVGSLPASGADA